jgi:hypothetical protein
MAPTFFTLGRQTKIMEDARELTLFFNPTDDSVRIGHVPVMVRPDFNTASRNVSQPVLFVPSFAVSDCLNA